MISEGSWRKESMSHHSGTCLWEGDCSLGWQVGGGVQTIRADLPGTTGASGHLRPGSNPSWEWDKAEQGREVRPDWVERHLVDIWGGNPRSPPRASPAPHCPPLLHPPPCPSYHYSHILEIILLNRLSRQKDCVWRVRKSGAVVLFFLTL